MPEYTIKDVRDIIQRRKKTIVTTSIISALLLFGIIFFSRPAPIYEAESAIKVERITTIGELLTGATKVSDPISTAMAMIKSFPVIEAVAKKAGIIPKDMRREDVLSSPKLMAAIKDIEDKIVTEKDQRGGNIIIIKAQHPDPKMAKTLVGLLAESYKEAAFYERNKNIIEETKLVNDKLADAEKKLIEARERLNQYRKALELTTVTDEQRVILERYVDNKKKVDYLRVKIARIDEEIKILKSGLALDDATRWIYTPGGFEAGILYQLNNTLRELRVKENALLEHYTSSHPEVVQTRQQKKIVVEQMISYLMAERKSHEAELKALEADMQQTYVKLKAIPDAAKAYSILEKEVAANEELYNKILLKQQEVMVKGAEMAEEVTIVRYPVEPKTPINRVTFIGNTIVSLLLSIIIGFIGGFVHEAIDTVPRKIDALSDILGMPILTTIPDWNRSDIFEILRNKYPDVSDYELRRYMSLPSHFLAESSLAEAYRAVVPHLILMAKENSIKVLAIVSSVAVEGTTTFASNLAICLSQSGRTVALIDANFRSPHIHELFGIKNKPGLADVLIGNYQWEQPIRRITDILMGEIQPAHLLSPAGLDNLYVLTSGESVENPSNFINSKRMESTITSLREFFDFVIIDTAPIQQYAETSILLKKVDASILLTEHERLSRVSLVKLRTHMENMKVKVVGAVLNRVKTIET